MARPKRVPFSPHLREYRLQHGFTQEEVAERIGITAEMVRRHERGISRPSPLYQRAYKELYLASEVELGLRPNPHRNEPDRAAGAAPNRDPATLRSGPLELRMATFLGNDDLADIKSSMQAMVSLDNRHGGAELTRLGGRLFRSLHESIGTGAHQPSIRKDLIATAGELAEITGWLAYDADEHDLVRRMNQEALYFTRLAGDTSIELLTLQNASMHAGFLNRPHEALDIANSVLDGSYHLTPRVRALFLIRKARALAQGGDASALQLIKEARSLYEDGTSATDPAWTWWIDERELQWHEAMCRQALGDTSHALDHFELSVEATPPHETRSQYLHRAYLLKAQTLSRSWDAAAETMKQLRPLTLQVASNRSMRIIRDALSTASEVNGNRIPGVIQDEGEHLHRVLDDIAL